MAIGASASYGGGKGELRATPYTQAPQVNDISELLAKLRPQQDEAGPAFSQRIGPYPTAGTQRAAFGSNGGRNAIEQEQLKALQLQNRDAAQRIRAKSRSAPTKELFGFNMHGRVMEDPEKLTGYEREFLLPQNSSQVGGFPQSGASLSPEMPMLDEAPDEGSTFRRAALGDALRQSNAGAQLRGLSMPNQAYGRR